MRSTFSAITVARLFIFTLAIFCLSTGAGFGAIDVTARDWPVSSPEAQGMDSEKLSDMLAETLGEKYHLDSLTIIRNGYMVLDVYYYPFKKDARHIIHSCTKSITSAAFGIAVNRGYIKDLDQPVYQIFPESSLPLEPELTVLALAEYVDEVVLLPKKVMVSLIQPSVDLNRNAFLLFS